jgi:uncharacterized membrane protein
MSEFVAISFKGSKTAEKVFYELAEMQKEYLVELNDACIVTRDQHGKLRLHQMVNTVAGGAVSGATWGGLRGVLIGLLFLNPLIGWAVGAAAGATAGALSGKLTDFGIDDNFIKKVGAAVTEDSSARFVLFKKVTLDRVLPDFEKHSGTILRTSLSEKQEAELRQALSNHLASPA